VTTASAFSTDAVTGTLETTVVIAFTSTSTTASTGTSVEVTVE
jgi:hypothetical protein